MRRTDTRLVLFLIAAMFVAVFSCSQALAQSPGAALDAALEKNAAQDASIAEQKRDTQALATQIAAEALRNNEQDAAIAERIAVDTAQGHGLIELQSVDAAILTRLEAIDKALSEGPVTPPTDPEPEPTPVTPWPLFLLNLDTKALTRFEAISLTAPPGRYTVQIGASATERLDAAPFQTSVNGAACTIEREPVYHVCGNDNALALLAGANSVAIAAHGDGEAVTLTVAIEAAGPDPAPEPNPGPGATAWKLQTATWYSAPSNPEETFANILHASPTVWTGGGMTTGALIEGGFVDRMTGLPQRLPNNRAINSSVYFTGSDDQTKAYWDGEWALDWCGDADLKLEYLPAEFQRRVGPNRVEFTRDKTGGKTPYHAEIKITRLDTPLTCLRMYRIENENRLRDGFITSTRFVEAMAGYDLFRNMDMVSANQSAVISVDDIATDDALHWANGVWQSEYRIPYEFQSIPLAATFAVAVETNTELWHQAPITIGAPQPFYDFETLALVPDPNDPSKPGTMQPVWDQWAGKYRAMARNNAAEIIASPEWDRYADAIVAAMIESGYPADRPLYTSLANEVWNFSGQYFMTTNYAWGIGEGLAYNSHEPLRVGYGALMARWKLALDAALKRAGRAQPVVYVIEGQAFFPARTMFALSGAKAYMESKGEAWATHAPDFGVSVASYWSATWGAFLSPEEWQLAIVTAPDGTAKRFADFIINDPAQFGLKSVLDVLGQNRREAEAYGVRMIGAYEGGSHLERPSYISKAWFLSFAWGEEGARVNTAVNRAIAAAFPGIILSNYILAGPIGGQPWFDCLYGKPNPLCDSWDEFKNQEAPQ